MKPNSINIIIYKWECIAPTEDCKKWEQGNKDCKGCEYYSEYVK